MYRLRQRLGRWGLGEVYEAVESPSGAVRMLKVVRGRRASDPHIRAHMEREYEASRACDHPFVVRIHGLEEDPQIGLYHVMDLMSGETLGAALKRGVTFLPDKVLQLAGRLAGALEVLETKGMGHFEFGPDAVFLWEPAAGEEHPLVINVGLPPTEGAPPPLPLEALAYAAPERRTSQSWDTRADVYSLCALLVHLLVGRPPPPQGWVTLPKVPSSTPLASDLADIAKRGLAPAPAQRYPSMQALATALRFLAQSAGVRLEPGVAAGQPAKAGTGPRRPPKAPGKRTVLGMPTLAPPGESKAGPGGGRPAGRTPPLPVASGATPPPPPPPKPNVPPELVESEPSLEPVPAGLAPLDEEFAPAVGGGPPLLDQGAGARPLEPDQFPGGETGSMAAYDPSAVSSLPTPPRRRLPLRTWLVAGGGLVLLGALLVVAFLWRPWRVRRGGRAPGPIDAGVASRNLRDAGTGGEPRDGAGAGRLDAETRAVRDAGSPPQGVDGSVVHRDARMAVPRPRPDDRPKSRFAKYLEEGRKALKRRRYALARRYFTKALRLRRSSATVMRLMAEAHYRAREYAAARYWYEKALQRSPRSASLNARLGKVYARLGKRSKACRYFLRALHLRPNSRRYRLNVENYRCR